MAEEKLFPWKDLLKVYGLMFGALLIVFPINITIVLMLIDPTFGFAGMCIGILPLLLGAVILWYILKKKTAGMTMAQPTYYYTPYYAYTAPYYGMHPYYQYQYQYAYQYQYPAQYQYYYHQPPPPLPSQQPQQAQQARHPQPQQRPQQQQQFIQPRPQQTPTYATAPVKKKGFLADILPSSDEPAEDRDKVEKLEIPAVKVLLPILLLSIAIGTFAILYGFTFVFVVCFIIAFSFPSLIWVSYVYSKDIHEPEPGRIVLIALTWGMLSTAFALLFEAPFVFAPAIITAALVAPVVEELGKPLILPFIKVKIDNELDGIIYGVTAGMGFAMMENLFYEMSVFFEPDVTSAATVWSIMALARGLGSTIGHAVGAGIIGYAYAKYIHGRAGFEFLVGAYGIAVALHMTWNGVLTVMDTFGMGDLAYVFIVVWPIVEFLILRSLLISAMRIDEVMFGPGARMREPTPLTDSGLQARPRPTPPRPPPARRPPAYAQARPPPTRTRPPKREEYIPPGVKAAERRRYEPPPRPQPARAAAPMRRPLAPAPRPPIRKVKKVDYFANEELIEELDMDDLE